MFGPPPDQPSAAEIEQAEIEAGSSVKNFFVACSVLYLTPHLIDYVKKLV